MKFMIPGGKKTCRFSDSATQATASHRTGGNGARYVSGKSFGLALALAFGLALPSFRASAARQLSIEVGPSYMDCASASAVFIEGVFDERRIGTSRLTWSPDVSVGWIDGRDVERYRYRRYQTTDSVWLIAGGARIHYGDDTSWYRPLFFSFQPAMHSGRTQALSSAYEFVSTLGWQGRHVNFQIRHISNGSLHEPNRGETMVLIGAAFDL
ncbi:acyloxyacyl hydrolase [Rhodanobacter sp. DHB23]|uniref:acyloxyacyl hydrolase n=1 Tax=Rhodanobacter sp. DHB23 TaxID=2775923 RepID=UPI001CE16F8F|nr:acyloxyacyl hydrolase [Rhodanobacter sp. DHB23]